MLKNIFTVCLFISTLQIAKANEIPVNIKPAAKITTSNVNLQEGDGVNFIVEDDVYVNSKLYLKKNKPVSGTITSIDENGYLYKPATLYIDNFVTENADEKPTKLKGIIYKKGNDHAIITQFIPLPLIWLRGGEVQIKPKKDVFTLVLDDKNDAGKIPVKISPVQIISTNHDEVETGDWINFEATHDVYVNDKLYIRKNTPISGFVDIVHPNGWANDKAEIYISKFDFNDTNNKRCETNSPLRIQTVPDAKPHIKELFTYYVLGTFRGSEIFIEPDTKIYNIFIEK